MNKRYFAERTLITIFLIWAVITALFFLFRLMPGDYIWIIAEAGATEEQLREIEARWGLDQPLYVQYYEYLINVLTGDMGRSFQHNQPVLDVVGRAILNTFILVAPAITFTYLLGAVIGTTVGMNRDSKADQTTISGLIGIGAVPEFFMGILLIIVFVMYAGIFPSGGMLPVSLQAELRDDPYYAMFFHGTFWLHYALPFVTIVLKMLYYPTLVMRTSVVEVQGQEFINYHRLKGLKSSGIYRRIMRHASLPIITMYPISMTRAIGGMIVIEFVFAWPGIGYLLINAVLSNDTPIIQFVFVVIAIWIILSNWIVDIVYGYVDPRVSVSD